MTDKDFYNMVTKHGLHCLLIRLGNFCESKAMEDENLVVQPYHDQWMAARVELLRCAETIRKGGE